MGGRAPNEYADCFEVLGELNVLPIDFVEQLKMMAKFRNFLVHLYWQVDNKKVYEIIKKTISDIKIYLQQIGKFVEENI